MSCQDSISSTPSEHLSSANTTAMTTPDVEHGPILDKSAAAVAQQQVDSALHHAAVEETLRGTVAATDRVASTDNQSATKTTLEQSSTATSSSATAPPAPPSGSHDHGRPATPAQGAKPKLTKLLTGVHPAEPLCRVFDPSKDDKKTIEELLARRPGPGPIMREYPIRPWDEEKEKKERQEDRELQVAKLRKAAEELSKLPFFNK